MFHNSLPFYKHGKVVWNYVTGDSIIYNNSFYPLLLKCFLFRGIYYCYPENLPPPTFFTDFFPTFSLPISFFISLFTIFSSLFNFFPFSHSSHSILTCFFLFLFFFQKNICNLIIVNDMNEGNQFYI